MSATPNIQFVDINDEPIGGGTKDEAYEKGIRRRIIRIFLRNSRGEILLQKRAANVPFGAGKWDDSVAGHVDEGETYLEAAARETQEEIGVVGLELTEVGYYYKEDSVESKGWKGFQRVYIADYDGDVVPNPVEISEIRWIQPDELDVWIARKPEEFTKGCVRTFNMIRKLL